MDTPLDPPHPPTPRRRRMVKWIIGGVVVLVALAGLGIWYFFRDDPPAAVDLDAATAALEDGAVATDPSVSVVTPTEPVAADAVVEPTTPAADTTAAPVPATGLAASWTVDTSIGTFSFEDSSGTFVGFRVQEELSGIGSTTASSWASRFALLIATE